MAEFFRKIAFIEGVTTLLLFFVAMPVKCLAGQPALVPPVGWMHGVAFIMYVIVMIRALGGAAVGPLGWARTLVAAFVPFGTFLNDPWLKRALSDEKPG